MGRGWTKMRKRIRIGYYKHGPAATSQSEMNQGEDIVEGTEVERMSIDLAFEVRDFFD